MVIMIWKENVNDVLNVPLLYEWRFTSSIFIISRFICYLFVNVLKWIWPIKYTALTISEFDIIFLSGVVIEFSTLFIYYHVSFLPFLYIKNNFDSPSPFFAIHPPPQSPQLVVLYHPCWNPVYLGMGNQILGYGLSGKKIIQLHQNIYIKLPLFCSCTNWAMYLHGRSFKNSHLKQWINYRLNPNYEVASRQVAFCDRVFSTVVAASFLQYSSFCIYTRLYLCW